MKKLFLTALLVPVMAFAQTYPSPTFNSLTLQNPLTTANGGTGTTSSTGSGAVVLSGSPAISTPTISGGTITNAPVSGSTGSFTTLAASSTVSGAGFTGLFAAPPAIGSTTPGTGSFTSLATTGWVEATALGFVGNGSTNNASAWASLAANTSAPHIYWPPGTYLSTSCTGVTFTAPVVWKGAPGSIIKFTCTAPAFPTGELNSNGQPVYIDGLTFDESTIANTAGINTTTFNPFFYIQNLSAGMWIQNNKFLGAPAQMADIFLNNVQGGNITGNYIGHAAPSRNSNQCIAMTNSGGLNTGIAIMHNTCVNTAMFLDGNGIRIVANDISGWGYGSGLTLGGTETPSVGPGWMEVTGNYTHSSQPWSDANAAHPSGIESWLPHNNITGNVVNTVSGSAIGLGGLATTIANNDLLNWGTCTDAACAGATAEGIELDNVNASYNGSGANIIGNRTTNPSSALTAYGYGENAGGMLNITLSGNTFFANGGNFPYSQIKGTQYSGTDVWNNYASTLTPSGGTGVTLALQSFRYNIQGHTVHFTIEVQLTYTTPPTNFTFTLPYLPNTVSVATGTSTATNRLMSAVISGSTVTMNPNGGFTSSGDFIVLSGQYDTQ